MKGRMEWLGINGALGAAALLLVGPSASEAQDRPMYELPAVTVVALSDADELHVQAMSLYEFPERWGEAARLHEQAANKLLDNDARAFLAYDRAARLYFYSGEYGRARSAMEKAASIAAATGDVLTAAHAYVDAAFITLWEGYGGKQREFTRMAEEYAASDLLDDADRSAILNRLQVAESGTLALLPFPSS